MKKSVSIYTASVADFMCLYVESIFYVWYDKILHS